MKINTFKVESISERNTFYNRYTISVCQKTRKMLFSNSFIVFVICIVTLSTILSVYYGALDYDESIFDASYWSAGVIAMTSLTFIAAISGIMGDLMMDRTSKVALPFYFAYIIIYGVQCYFWSLYYEMIQQAVVFILVFISLLNWGRKNASEEDTKIKFLNRWDFYLLCIGLIGTTIILGSLMWWVINPWIDNASVYDADGWLDYGLTPWWAWRGADPYPFLDAYAFVSFLGAWILFTKRYQNAYWVMLASIIGYFFIYGLMAFQQGISSYVVYFATNFFYLFLNQTGMSNWNVTYLAQQEMVNIEIK